MVGRVGSSAAGAHPAVVWGSEQSSDSKSSCGRSGEHLERQGNE